MKGGDVIIEAEKTYCVYMHKNRKNGKVYIGITGGNPLYRWNHGKGYKENEHFSRAINKYGWEEGFDHIILNDGLSKEEAEKLEIEYISKYNSTDQDNGYNIQLGGNLNHSQHVFQYDRKTGLFMKEWINAIAIEKEYGIPNANVCSVALGKMKTAGGFYFSREYLGDNLPNDIMNRINRNDCWSPVARYDINGKFIKAYKCMKDAENDVGGKVQMAKKTSLGYIWKYINDEDDYTQDLTKEEVLAHKRGARRSQVNQYGLDGALIQTWESETAAAKGLGTTQSAISSAARGDTNKCCGYYWKYVNDFNGTKLPDKELERLRAPQGGIAVLQYAKDGSFISRYCSLTQAAEELSLYTNAISHVCMKINKTCGGYIWRYESDPLKPEELKEINSNKRKRAVLQLDNCGNVINSFDSIADAERATTVKSSVIRKCCNGKSVASSEFKWKYAD